MPTGERAQFVLSPACEKGHVICSIRRHQMRDMILNDYEKVGAFADLAIDAAAHYSHDAQLKYLYQQKIGMNL